MPHCSECRCLFSRFAFGALLLAGFVKGFIGMGLPTIATGLLTLVMAPGHAAGLLVVPNFSPNAWQALAGSKLRALVRRPADALRHAALDLPLDIARVDGASDVLSGDETQNLHLPVSGSTSTSQNWVAKPGTTALGYDE
jgi:hypothetical protein